MKLHFFPPQGEVAERSEVDGGVIGTPPPPLRGTSPWRGRKDLAYPPASGNAFGARFKQNAIGWNSIHCTKALILGSFARSGSKTM